MAVMADEKWVQNADAILGRTRSYDLKSAVWLGLVRMLNQEMLVPLSRAGKLADEALGFGIEVKRVVVGEVAHGAAGISIDMQRFRSAQNVAASVALTLGGTRRRGRRRETARRKSDALRNAAHYGVDIDLLKAGLKMTPGERLQELSENAEFLNAIRKVRTR